MLDLHVNKPGDCCFISTAHGSLWLVAQWPGRSSPFGDLVWVELNANGSLRVVLPYSGKAVSGSEGYLQVVRVIPEREDLCRSPMYLYEEPPGTVRIIDGDIWGVASIVPRTSGSLGNRIWVVFKSSGVVEIRTPHGPESFVGRGTTPSLIKEVIFRTI